MEAKPEELEKNRETLQQDQQQFQQLSTELVFSMSVSRFDNTIQHLTCASIILAQLAECQGRHFSLTLGANPLPSPSPSSLFLHLSPLLSFFLPLPHLPFLPTPLPRSPAAERFW